MAAKQLYEVVIVSAARTPIGSLSGALSSISGPLLAAQTIKHTLSQGHADPMSIQECIMGNVISAGMGQAPARQSAIFGGLSPSTVCTTINKVCASGMKAIMLGAQSIMLGQQQVVIAGGFESMSNVPYYLLKARSGYRYNHEQIFDGIVKDGLWHPYGDHHMGTIGELCAQKYRFSREDQDKYAIESYKRAQNAQESGRFKAEIVPVKIQKRGSSPITINEDEEPKKIDLEKLATLKPAFNADGTITAANASKINDGAATVLLTSAEFAQKNKLKPLAIVRGFADAELKPIDFPIAPATAIPRALNFAGLTTSQIDLWEINEAFSVVALANMKVLELNHDKVNVDGGAVALGHPIGMSGARLVTHLLFALHQRNLKYGCASICNGGGGASAIVIERV